MNEHVTVDSFSKDSNKKNLIFVSFGDNETFLSYCMENLLDNFDVAIFFYGKSFDNYNKFAKSSVFSAYGRGTKFNVLKFIYSEYRDFLMNYESIWVVDDDATYVKGDVSKLPKLLDKFKLKVLSPAQDPRGRMSHNIMRPHLIKNKLRFVNFIEMGWPMFSKSALQEFLDHYDGSLQGVGIDIWYSNCLGLNSGLFGAIIDDVVFLNPYEIHKENSKRELDRFNTFNERLEAWNSKKSSLDLQDWEHENLMIGSSIKKTPLPINLLSLLAPVKFHKPLRSLRDFIKFKF